MKIQINDNRLIKEIQEEFNECFPYLKIEFFSKPHKSGEGSSKKFIKHNDKTINECRTKHNKGVITIVPEMSVTDLEQQFNEIYGLSVQVFRKSGKLWLETTVTDSWSLSEQNRQGEALSSQVA